MANKHTSQNVRVLVELVTLYLWQQAGSVLGPPLVDQLSRYWRAEELLAGAGIKNVYKKIRPQCIHNYTHMNKVLYALATCLVVVPGLLSPVKLAAAPKSTFLDGTPPLFRVAVVSVAWTMCTLLVVTVSSSSLNSFPDWPL